MDAPRSGFLSELESFWNGWASARKDIILIVCGSSTSWMVKKIVKNKGGLHNRLTHRISLKPFSLGLCEKFCESRGIHINRQQILDAYMIFGGIPYYWSLLRRGVSVTQEIDRLIFSEEGELHDEFEMLYAALFKRPEQYVKVIELLASKKSGMTRAEIINEGNMENNGATSEVLDNLEWCGFIRSYHSVGHTEKYKVFQLMDSFTLFYLQFVKGRHSGPNYWSSLSGTPKYNSWRGLAFERVCLVHVTQIKMKLGITGIVTNEYSWKYAGVKDKGLRGAQVDLVLDRSDGIIDLCEIKNSPEPYRISQSYCSELDYRRQLFTEITRTKKAVHTVIIASDGVSGAPVQMLITLDDLFT